MGAGLSNHPKFLIVKTSSLGDIIHAYHFIAKLRELFPLAQIDWLVEEKCKELVERHPDVNRAWVVDTKAWRKGWWKRSIWKEFRTWRKSIRRTCYDYVFDLQGNTKSGLLLSQVRGLHKVGYSYEFLTEWPNLLFTTDRVPLPRSENIRQDLIALIEHFWGKQKNIEPLNLTLRMTDEEKEILNEIWKAPFFLHTPLVMLCPGSFWENKKLSECTLRTCVERLIREKNAFIIFIWGSEKERLLAQHLHQDFPSQSFIFPKVSPVILQNAMRKVSAVIAMDSFALHLAGISGIKTFGFFGPSRGQKTKPFGDLHVSYQGSCPYHMKFYRQCSKMRTCATGACMKDISEADAWKHLKNIV